MPMTAHPMCLYSLFQSVVLKREEGYLTSFFYHGQITAIQGLHTHRYEQYSNAQQKN